MATKICSAYYIAEANDPTKSFSAIVKLGIAATGFTPSASTDATTVTFVNDSPKESVEVFWVSYEGQKTKYHTLEPKSEYTQSTFVGHVWYLEKPDEAPEESSAADVASSVYYFAEARNPRISFADIAKLGISATGFTPSARTDATTVTFVNDSKETVEVFWIAFDGKKTKYHTLAPSSEYTQSTYVGHVWRLEKPDKLGHTTTTESKEEGSREEEGQKKKKSKDTCHHCGTVWFCNTWFPKESPTAFTKLSAPSRVVRTMFDWKETRKSGGGGGKSGWVKHNVHLYIANYGGTADKPTKTIEVQINPEYSSSEADAIAKKFAPIVGRLPAFLLSKVESLWISKGNEPFGGGNNNIMIYPEKALEYERDGVLMDALVHEGTHTSVDPDHLHTRAWKDCIASDPCSVSPYAKDHPDREDISELMGPYLAQKFFADTVPEEQVQKVRCGVPARIKYLDGLNLTMDIIQ